MSEFEAGFNIGLYFGYVLYYSCAILALIQSIKICKLKKKKKVDESGVEKVVRMVILVICTLGSFTLPYAPYIMLLVQTIRYKVMMTLEA